MGGKDCIEEAHLDSDMAGVRDSKNPHDPALIFGAVQWDAFADPLAGAIGSTSIPLCRSCFSCREGCPPDQGVWSASVVHSVPIVSAMHRGTMTMP